MNPVLTSSPVYPFAALEARKNELRAKGVRLHDFTIGDPNDAGTLSVVGFDTAAPQLMADFARGEV